MNFSASSGRIRNKPSGLFMSEAIFARNLFTEMPAEAVRPVLDLMSFLILLAMTVADPIFFLSHVTSRNASSIDSGSIKSVYSLNISIILEEISVYLLKLCFTNIRSGHNRLAITEGIADLIPNFTRRYNIRQQFSLSVQDYQAAQLMQKMHPYRYE